MRRAGGPEEGFWPRARAVISCRRLYRGAGPKDGFWSALAAALRTSQRASPLLPAVRSRAEVGGSSRFVFQAWHLLPLTRTFPLALAPRALPDPAGSWLLGVLGVLDLYSFPSQLSSRGTLVPTSRSEPPLRGQGGAAGDSTGCGLPLSPRPGCGTAVPMGVGCWTPVGAALHHGVGLAPWGP